MTQLLEFCRQPRKYEQVLSELNSSEDCDILGIFGECWHYFGFILDSIFLKLY